MLDYQWQRKLTEISSKDKNEGLCPAGLWPFRGNRLIETESVTILNRITINEYAKKHIKSNPDQKIQDVKAALKEAVKRQKDGAVCVVCGYPIWALGSAFSGFDGCFTCITREVDDSDDYEVYGDETA